jgi:hypothetical protein
MSELNIPFGPEDIIKREKFMLEHQTIQNRHEINRKNPEQEAEANRMMCRPLVLDKFKEYYTKAFNPSDRDAFMVEINMTCPDYKNDNNPLFPGRSSVKIEGETYKINQIFTASSFGDFGMTQEQNRIFFKKK